MVDHQLQQPQQQLLRPLLQYPVPIGIGDL